ncbi:MAG: DUF1611 domain-containing protein [Pseudolabrys sp.]|nr:DUF1611 domain-containing protein [Pseudolabrys sp.]
MRNDRGFVAADIKTTSVLRRVPPLGRIRHRAIPAREGDVCLFKLGTAAAPITVEAASGRFMTVVPGDIFLATPGYRESTRWVVGEVPDRGLVASRKYWVLADSGVVGQLIGDSPREKGHLERVTYLGAVCDKRGAAINIRQFAVKTPARAPDRGAPVFLVVGTSSHVGKTTAVMAVLQALRDKGHENLVALKATGTSSIDELGSYRDYGAAQAFDCVDFGLPTTYPSARDGMHAFFDRALNTCLSIRSDAVVIECGGDLFGANVPVFLECLKDRRSEMKVILAAPDAPAVLGAKSVLHEMGLSITVVTGPCTDTPTLQERTEALCGIPAVNMAEEVGIAAP